MKTSGADGGLPLGGNRSVSPARRVILASHLIWTGYGHWLPNDPRGSGSDSLRKDELAPLGPIHHGRNTVQPPRTQLKQFYREATEVLEHPTLWFNDEMRRILGDAMGRAGNEHGYTVFAFAVCSNHAHAVIRSHRDRSESIWMNLAEAGRSALRTAELVSPNHPVWATRPYKVFLRAHEDVRGRIKYVSQNPVKEGLAPQRWEFVRPF
jgi:REP element-mobilizing transposase RayT